MRIFISLVSVLVGFNAFAEASKSPYEKAFGLVQTGNLDTIADFVKFPITVTVTDSEYDIAYKSCANSESKKVIHDKNALKVLVEEFRTSLAKSKVEPSAYTSERGGFIEREPCDRRWWVTTDQTGREILAIQMPSPKGIRRTDSSKLPKTAQAFFTDLRAKLPAAAGVFHFPLAVLQTNFEQATAGCRTSMTKSTAGSLKELSPALRKIRDAMARLKVSKNSGSKLLRLNNGTYGFAEQIDDCEYSWSIKLDASESRVIGLGVPK